MDGTVRLQWCGTEFNKRLGKEVTVMCFDIFYTNGQIINSRLTFEEKRCTREVIMTEISNIFKGKLKLDLF